MKKVLLTRKNPQKHWVGDGFPVSTVFSYANLAREMSPFLLLDYASPMEFAPSQHIRGVGEHPHRGFETVTIVYAGEVEHRDSAGGGGAIGPGDVQWMTAASGVVHEEMHGKNFAKNGGPFEMVQLWVNLPAKEKMTSPRYQAIVSASIPVVELADSAGRVRVIAGAFQNQHGPAKTFTPINLWDACLAAHKPTRFKTVEGHTTAVFVLSGRVQFEGGESVAAAELAVLEKSGEEFLLTASEDAKLLILSGAPIDEPVVGQGPFVMNTKEEIQQAIMDYQNGRMGHLS